VNETVRLVARRELTERIHERSFLISTGITLAIVVVVLVLPALLGFGGPNEYTVALAKIVDLRSGENPHQLAAFYAESSARPRPPARTRGTSR